MSIRINRINQIEGPVQAAARHPYMLLLMLFYAVAGIAAGVSAAGMITGEAAQLAAFFGELTDGGYQVLPPLIRSTALNLLLYCLACLPRLWPPLFVAGSLCISLKGVCLGVSLRCLLVELGVWGLVLGVPLCILPALFCMAALALQMLADAREKAGFLQGGLSLRSIGFLAVCILIESAAAPVALRAFLLK